MAELSLPSIVVFVATSLAALACARSAQPAGHDARISGTPDASSADEGGVSKDVPADTGSDGATADTATALDGATYVNRDAPNETTATSPLDGSMPVDVVESSPTVDALACGGPGELCCSVDYCREGGCCVPSSRGRVCVASGQTCNDGTACVAGSCASRTTGMACGNVDQPCCGGSFFGSCTAPAVTCANRGLTGRCAACGSQGEPCCERTSGAVCRPGLACPSIDPRCEPCGGRNQVCCHGADGCQSGFVCGAGPRGATCLDCGGRAQLCCQGAGESACQPGLICGTSTGEAFPRCNPDRPDGAARG